jgi:hypothetical protein
MKLNEINKIAARSGIKPGKMKKAEIIRAIQKAENNFDCYGTSRIEICNERGCLWRIDCLKEKR